MAKNGLVMPEDKRPNKKAWKGKDLRQIGLLGTIPMLMAAGPLIGFFGGKWLDSKLGTEPYLMIILLFMGFAASVKETVKILKQANQDNEDEEL